MTKRIALAAVIDGEVQARHRARQAYEVEQLRGRDDD